ncbi:hypothetical protein VP01_2778g2 [Puccinia sorghi]|uniref:Uncharacterized protein n=1 Tax=Puccinia sorghi TaxID=27349 RepID=A0A0L6V2R6_9BASI|nr:hypothetical protein VP01_2778g2 [Puccinia sorghi]
MILVSENLKSEFKDNIRVSLMHHPQPANFIIQFLTHLRKMLLSDTHFINNCQHINPGITLNCEKMYRAPKSAHRLEVYNFHRNIKSNYIHRSENILWICKKQFNFFSLKNYLFAATSAARPFLECKQVAWHCKSVLELGGCMAIKSNVLELQGITWEFKVRAWHCRAVHGNSEEFPETARKCVKMFHNEKEYSGTARQRVAIQRNGLKFPGSVWHFKGMAWNWQAVCGNEKKWPGPARECMKILRNGLALKERIDWHFKAVCENSKKWPGTARQCMSIQRNCLAFQGRIAWNCKSACHHNSNKWSGTGRQCMSIQRNGLAMYGNITEGLALQVSVWQFKLMGCNSKEVGGNSKEWPGTETKNGLSILGSSVKITRNGRELKFSEFKFQRMAWHCQEVSGISKEWPSTARKLMESKNHGLVNSDKGNGTARKWQFKEIALPGSVWDLKGMAWHREAEMHGNLKECPGTARWCMAIGRHGLLLARQWNSKEWPEASRQCIKIQRNVLEQKCMEI